MGRITLKMQRIPQRRNDLQRCNGATRVFHRVFSPTVRHAELLGSKRFIYSSDVDSESFSGLMAVGGGAPRRFGGSICQLSDDFSRCR
jgi:hypothetical protein